MSALDRISELQWENEKLKKENAELQEATRKKVDAIIAESWKSATLRDQFAMAAVMGIIGRELPMEMFVGGSPDMDMIRNQVATDCYSIADAMLEARKGES
jgi:hypothetical protein